MIGSETEKQGKSQTRNTGITKRHSTRTTNLHGCLLIEDDAKKCGTELVTTPYQQWCKSKNAPLETIGILNLWKKTLETKNTRWRNPWTSCSQCWTCSTAEKNKPWTNDFVCGIKWNIGNFENCTNPIWTSRSLYQQPYGIHSTWIRKWRHRRTAKLNFLWENERWKLER